MTAGRTGLGGADGVPGDEVGALQGLLATEHAAAWGWGAAGALLDGAARDLAREALAAHLARRDRLRVLLRDRGEDPVPSAAAYELPGDPEDAGDALALGLRLEEGVAAAQVRAVSLLAAPDLRAAVVSALTGAAVRAARVRGLLDPTGPPTVPFPGQDGLTEPLPPSPAPASPDPAATGATPPG